jgi:ribosomal protein S19
MNRSIWKSQFINLAIFKLTIFQKQKIWSRSSTVPSFLIGKYVFVYNGKEFKKIFIDRCKKGYKFGDFSISRKTNLNIKLKTRKNKKKA